MASDLVSPAVRIPLSILKRDGSTQLFDRSRIVSAVARAGAATGEFGPAFATTVAQRVIDAVTRQAAGDTPTVEAVQDLVERALIDAGCVITARAYIVYREQHKQLRADRTTLLDVSASMDEYLDQRDWRVNANANQGYSLGGLILNVAGKVTANYWLNHVYPYEVGVAHREGDLHLHDLDMLSGYCAGWSLRTLLAEGFNGVPGRVEAGPPKHLSSAVGQIVNFLGTLQNEWAGAQAFSSFDTYLAPYVRRDAMSYEAVKQCIQELIYNLNVPSRWGSQTPFTNLTFDWVCPEDLRAETPAIAGEEMPFTYGDLGPEMEMINRAYIEVMVTGDAKGRVFTFPIPTYNITADFPWDSPHADALFEMTAKYGLPYFQNFLKSDLKPNMIRSMCCRLQLDLRELLEARQRPFRLRRADGIPRRRDAELRSPGLSLPRRRSGALRAHRRAPRHRPHEPRDQAEDDPASHGQPAFSVHEAVSGDAPQSLLHPRRERNQRDDPQLHRGRE